MSLGVLIALGSAGLQPFFPGLARRGHHPLTVNFWGMSVATLAFSFCFWGESYWERVGELWGLIFLSSILKVIYVNINLPLLARHEFQVMYPLSRISPLLIMLGEIVWLGSSFTLWQVVGVVGIISGALIFGFDKEINGVRMKVFSLIFLMTIFYTIAILIDKRLIGSFSPAEVVSFSIFQLPFLAPILFLKKEEAKKDLTSWNTFWFSLAMLGSYFLMVWAFKYLEATVVTSIRNLSILFGVFLGAHLFQEGHKVLKYLAALFICGGVFLTIFCE